MECSRSKFPTRPGNNNCRASTGSILLAWSLACGSKVAEKTSAIGYADGVLTVEVPDATWQQQLQGLNRQYLAALKQISAEPVSTIKFVVRNQSERPSR